MNLRVGGWHRKGEAARSRRRWRRRFASALAGIGLPTVILLFPSFSHAQGTSITSSGLLTCVGAACSGSGTPLPTGGKNFDITGGTAKGANLFHSFGLFSVGAGDIANFNNTNGLAITNILGRVTEGQVSNISGTIQTTNFGTANLFLINPAGWIFGPTASLNVGGSFHVSTANYLRFADGGIFSADNTPLPNNGLLATNPVAFGFLGPTGSISIEGSNLSVDRGNTLSIVGGDVTIREDPLTLTAPALTAPGGRIQIGSFASAGEATVDGLNGAFTSLGRVQISGGASINAAGDVRIDADGNPSVVNGGTVLIRGGQVNILGASLDASGTLTFDADGNPLGTAGGAVIIRGGQLFADGSAIFTQTFGNEPGAAVGINIQMDESIAFTNGTFLQTATFGSGRGGDVRLMAAGGAVAIDASTIITASLGGEGVGGDVAVEAGTISLTGGSTIQSLVQSFTGDGRGGKITMSATDSISIGGGSGLFSVTQTSGNGGLISVSAPSGSLTMDGGAQILSQASFEEGPGGAGGPIVIDVRDLSLNGATINSINSAPTPDVPSQGGSVTVTATGNAEMSGENSGIFSIAFGAPAGDITVQAGTLRLTDRALIQGGIFIPGSTPGQGGNVTVGAQNSILITDGAGISSQAATLPVGRVAVSAPSLTLDGGFINAGTLDVGRAGDIMIEVGTLTLTKGGQIVSSSVSNASGDGGTVTITATGSVAISGSAPESVLPEPFRSFVQDTASGIFSTTSADSIGNAGSITVSTPTLNVSDGGKVSVTTSGAGAGGAITITGRNAVSSASISGVGSGLFSTASSTGDAGTILVSMPTLTMADGGTISVATSGAGNAGNIGLNVGNFGLTGGAQVVSSTTGAGQGGNVTVMATGPVSISGSGSQASGLFSTASSTGNAGQITVSTPTLTMGDGGTISVATSGAGNAGDIALNVNDVTMTGAARVDSGTTGSGNGGTVTLNATGSGIISSGAGLFSNAEGSGAGGDLNIQAAQLQLLDGATISARSTGTDTATAGNVNIVAGSLLRMVNSSITTEATVADGGNISITTTGSTLRLTNSQITTSVQSGVGQGGNITIGSAGHPFDFILLGDSQIRADAFGGPGGNINMFATVYLTSNSVVSASSALSTPGTIAIEATVTDVSGSLTQLPTTPLEAAALMRASCAARLAGGKTSSLVVAGREGLPLDPSGLLPSPLTVEPPVAALAPDEEFPWVRNLLWVSYLSLDPKCLP